MNKKLLNNKNKEILACSWFLIFVSFLTLRLLDLHEIAPYLEWIFIISTPFVAYCIRDNRRLSVQLFIIDLYFGAVWGFAILNKLSHKNHKDLILVGSIAFFVTAIILFNQVVCYIKSLNLYNTIRKHWILLIPIVIFIIFSFETIFEIPWHDAEYYYCWEIKKLSYWFDFTWYDISNYTLAAHFSLGYSLIALLAELIYPQNAVVLHSFNIILALISAVSLYRIFNLIYPNKTNIIKILCMSVYLFSPWLLGIIGFINIDVPSIYFFVILVSCFLHGYRLLEIVLCFLFIYTKEPSAIYFSFMYLGILICDYRYKTEYKNFSLIKLFAFIFEEIKKYIFEIIVIVTWAISFLIKFDSNWGSVQGSIFENNKKIHCFGFTVDNLISKAKGVFLINFNWIFTIIVVITIIKTLLKKEERKNTNKDDNTIRYYYVSILYMTFLGFMLFNIFYIDFEAPRYNAIGAVLFILIGLDLLICNYKVTFVKVISIILAVLMLVQSMITIDPVTIGIYDKVTDYGKNTIICPFKGSNDLMAVYNREYSYYFKALERILIECNYDGNEDIILKGVPAPYGPLVDYWWDDNENRMYSTKNNNTIMINFIWEKEGYNKLNPENEVKLYVYPYSYADDNCRVVSYRTVKIKYKIEE